jgi:hypothetical protein
VAHNEPPPVTERRQQPSSDQRLDAQLSAEASAPVVKKKGPNVVVPVILGVLGIGSGVAAAVFGLQAKSAEATYKSTNTFFSDAQSAASTAKTDALLTNIMFAVGGALLVAAIATLIFSS